MTTFRTEWIYLLCILLNKTKNWDLTNSSGLLTLVGGGRNGVTGGGPARQKDNGVACPLLLLLDA